MNSEKQEKVKICNERELSQKIQDIKNRHPNDYKEVLKSLGITEVKSSGVSVFDGLREFCLSFCPFKMENDKCYEKNKCLMPENLAYKKSDAVACVNELINELQNKLCIHKVANMQGVPDNMCIFCNRIKPLLKEFGVSQSGGLKAQEK